MKLFNLTHNGKQYVSELAPSVLPSSNYSFIDITYSDSEISSIVGTYLTDQKFEIKLENIKLEYNLNIFIEQLSDKEQRSILSTVNFITLPNTPKEEYNIRIKKIFILGLSSTLIYLYYLSLGRKEILSPIEFTFPFPININLVDNKVFNYINYIGSLSVVLNNFSIGRFWMEQIISFFKNFSKLLPNEYVIDSILITNIAHDAIRGYSGYVYEEIYKSIDLFNTAEESADKAIGKISKEVDEIYDEVKIFKKKLFQDLEERRIQIETSLSVDLKQLLYDEVPRITEDIDKSLDLKLYKILSKKVEDCFAEVLYEYKETAAYRLRDVLEPVVYESIDKFKSMSILSENFLKNAVNEARVYSKECKEFVKNFNTLNDDFYNFQEKTFKENIELKDEIYELKDQLYSLNKLVERLCSINNLKLK